MDIRYSLGYCQGDGMAFYGSVSLNDVLLKRLFEPRFDAAAYERVQCQVELAKWKELSEYISLSLTSNSTHYNHYNTMSVNVELDDGLLHDAIENGELCFYQSVDDLDVDEICSELEEIIKSDIVHISRTLEAEGYAFIGAVGRDYNEDAVIYMEERGPYKIVVEVDERDDFDEFLLDSLIGTDSGDDLALIRQVLKEIEEGNLRCASLSARLELLDEDGEVSMEVETANIAGVTYNPKTKDFGGCEHELAGELRESIPKEFISKGSIAA